MNPSFPNIDGRFAWALVLTIVAMWAVSTTFGHPIYNIPPEPGTRPAPAIVVPATLLTDESNKTVAAAPVAKHAPDLVCPCYNGQPCNCPCSVSLAKALADLKESREIRAKREAEWTDFYKQQNDWRRERGFSPMPRRGDTAVNNGFDGEGRPSTGQYGRTESFNGGWSMPVNNGGWSTPTSRRSR